MNNKTAAVHPDINKVLQQYAFDFSEVKIFPLGQGHINKTYKLTTPDSAFVLQQINQIIFPKTRELSANTQQINQYLLQQAEQGHYALQVPQQLLSISGDNCIQVGDNYWRLMEFVSNSYTVEEVTTPEQAAVIASAFAHFSRALTHFPANNLTIILDHFHDIRFRMHQLSVAVQHDSLGRLADCKPLVDAYYAQQPFIDHVIEISNKLPIHVTHNDTKINNLLFGNDDKPCAIIDLDTCMPGLLMHDFGDMVRSCCSNIAEDDGNIDQMEFNIDIFKALMTNYQNALGDSLTLLEKESLIIGAKLLPFCLSTRFLTDYLNGDKYFPVSREKHNVDRAKNQFQLFTLICNAEPQLLNEVKS